MFKEYYPTLYKKDSIKIIVSKFNRLIKKYHIIEFLNEDPVVGLPMEYPSLVDSFVEEVRIILENKNVLQRKTKFAAINQFVDMIDCYNGFLSIKLYPVNNIFKPQYNDVNRNSKLYNEISKYKKDLDNLYGKINKNCSMFFVSK